jgi:hypothetical protein
VPLTGRRGATLSDARRPAAFYAAAMATYGAAVTCCVNMPEGLARSPALNVLEREHGALLPLPALLLRRVVGAMRVSLLTLLGVYLVAGVLFQAAIPTGGGRCC